MSVVRYLLTTADRRKGGRNQKRGRAVKNHHRWFALQLCRRRKCLSLYAGPSHKIYCGRSCSVLASLERDPERMERKRAYDRQRIRKLRANSRQS